MQKGVFLLLSLFLIAADQISKWAVTELLLRPRLGDTGTLSKSLAEWYAAPPAQLPFAQIEIAPFFNFVMVWNKGISFGLFNHDSGYGSLLLVAISLLITIAFLVILVRNASTLQSFGIALIIGGAIGNVIDRLRFGAVIDFLDFHLDGHHWPAFNVADSCICVGVTLLIVHGLFFEKKVQTLKVTNGHG